jgi:DNA-binding Lrp family transcriptional regulator
MVLNIEIFVNVQNFYSNAHLFVAAIRILEHRFNRPPALKEIAEMLSLSLDETARISRRLEEAGITKSASSGNEERFYIADHLAIENIPKDTKAPAMMEEVMRMKAEKEAKLSKLEGLMKKGPVKPDLFSELDKALKDPASINKKPNPLD